MSYGVLSRLITKINYLLYLIETKQTGTPLQLANRLDISERQLYRILNDVKELGIPIKYSSSSQTYYFLTKEKYNIELTVSGQPMKTKFGVLSE